MSQHDMNIANGDGATVRADINSALGAIASNNAGSSAPSTTFAHQWWFDESTNLLKQRNAANTAWVIIGIKDASGFRVYYNGSEMSAGGSGGSHAVCEGRLTLTSGTPVLSSDVAGATTLYWTPYKGNNVGLYDGSSAWNVEQLSELSLSLSGYTADKNYDIFIDYNGGTPQLASLVWTDDTNRATALTLQDGVHVLSGATDWRYVGTIRINSTGGQCDFCFGSNAASGQAAFLGVWNMYNRVIVEAHVGDTTDSWTYSTLHTWRPSNNSADNRISYVMGLAEEGIAARFGQLVTSASGVPDIGIGYDSTTAFSGVPARANVGTGYNSISAFFNTLSLGFHYLQAIELAHTSTSATFFGDNGSDPTGDTGQMQLQATLRM